MIDIHAHILPAVDDGAADLHSALAMAELAVSGGVTAIVATPHCGLPGQDLPEHLRLLARTFDAFRQALEDSGSPLQLYPGMEIFGTRDTARYLDKGLLTTLNGSRYPLIEFPFRDYSREATDILRDLLDMGLRPVVAHPERYQYVQAFPPVLNLWADMGCLFQINRGSLLGRFGAGAEELSFAMVSRGFVCSIASDAHSPLHRTTWMQDIRELIRDEFSPSTAQLLLEERPRLLLEDKLIPMNEPDWF